MFNNRKSRNNFDRVCAKRGNCEEEKVNKRKSHAEHINIQKVDFCHIRQLINFILPL